MAKKIGVLWDEEVDWQGHKPFKKRHVNTSYEYFSELAADKGAKVFIGKYSWYNHEGMEKAYVFDGEKWSKVKDIDLDVILDKYKFSKETIPLKKEIGGRHPVLNSFEIEKICKDKLLAFEKFQDHHPETREATKENVKKMLKKHEKVVVKPVSAHAGEGVKIIEDVKEFTESGDKIVQQFIDSSSGIEELGIEGVHDLRVVLVDGEPVVSYIRQPKSGFVANVSQGGSMKFIEVENVPKSAMDMVEQVKKVFDEQKHFVCGVDMIFDQNRKPWILELNSKPGMSFYEDKETKSWKKPYIKAVVGTLVEMS